MNCPFCGTENPDDAQECSNCSADLGSLFKGTPPPESYAPTMMTSSAEIASMLAAAREESPAEPETPAEPEISDPSLEEVPMEEIPVEDVPMDEAPADLFGEAPVEEVPMEEVPMAMPEPPAIEAASPYAPTMISSMPPEVSEALAAAQAEQMPEEAPVEMAESVELAAEEPAAPTFVGIPDPLGMSDSSQIPAAEPVPPHIPAYNEPVITPTPVAPSDTPEAPKDNKRWWIIGGIGCLVIMCCVCVILPAVFYLINMNVSP